MNTTAPMLVAPTKIILLWGLTALFLRIASSFYVGVFQTELQEKVPIEYQGRVFSFMMMVISLAYFLGPLIAGVTSDYFFEPFMTSDNPLNLLFRPFFGDSKGSGIALFYEVIGFFVLILGVSISFRRSLILYEENH
jgi:MFS family permease